MARRKRQQDRLTAEDIRRIEAAVRREAAVEDGYYDGRHAPRVFVDQRKRENKAACRRWKMEE